MAPHADETPAPSPPPQQEQSQSHPHANGNDSSDSLRNEPRYQDYIQWKTLPPGGALNRWSQAVTREHDFPGAQVS